MDDDDTNNGVAAVGPDDDDQVDDDDDDALEDDEQAEAGGDTANGSGGNSAEPILSILAVPNLDSLYGLREIGREALCWQLSSAKPGNGVEQIRDQSTDTYWQSDGVSQPHWIQVHFARREVFEYWAHAASIVLVEDYPIHAVYMREKREGEGAKKWLDEHNLHDLRTHVLNRLRENGPMQPRDFDAK